MNAPLSIEELESKVNCSELLCVCEVCVTPFITKQLNYTEKSKITCPQCGASHACVVRVRKKSSCE